MKICTCCNLEKSYEFFSFHNKSKDERQDKCKECVKKYMKDRYAKTKHIQLEKQKERLKTDLQYKMIRRLRNRLYYALKNRPWKKNTHFSQYIGCTQIELLNHIESQFKNGMNWEILNKGLIHIDHKIPLSSATTEEELYNLCHYKNLQPMWAVDNIKKSNNV